MREVVTVARYLEVAEDLQERIENGEFDETGMLPKLPEIEAHYRISTTTARDAVKELKRVGLVVPVKKRGTVIRVPPTRDEVVIRSQVIDRDEYGYFSGTATQHWKSLSAAVQNRPAPAEIAAIFRLAVKTPLVVRARTLGDLDKPVYRHAADSWLHPDVVRDVPVLAEKYTGVGGTYDRIEEWHGHPLSWFEEVGSQTPTRAEAKELLLPPGVPMLRVLRISYLGKWHPESPIMEITDTRMSGELFRVRYPIERVGGARWPVQPATKPFDAPDHTGGTD